MDLAPQDWNDAIGDSSGTQIIVGGPGTGKTEFLVRRAVHLLESGDAAPDRVLILSFSRRGAADISQRIRARLDNSVGNLDISTYHSLAARIVERWPDAAGWPNPPVILTGPEQTAMVRDLLATEDPKDWPTLVRGLLRSPTFAREITDFALRATEQLLDADDIEHLAADRPDWRPLPAFLRRYQQRVIATGRIDYAMVISGAVAILNSGPQNDPLVDYVLVDEYQDTTRSQVGLLQALTAGTRNLTVVADPFQSIFSFRGATPQHVSSFEEDFPGPTVRHTLTTSFRVSANVLAAAQRVISPEDPGAPGSVIPAREGGRVECLIFGQKTQEAEWIGQEIHRLHLEQNVPLSRIGVFVRSKQRFLNELSRALQRRGLAHDVPDSRLTDQPAVRFVLDLITAISDTEETAENRQAIRRILLGPMVGATVGEVREIETSARATATPLAGVLAGRVPDGDALAELLSNASWASEMPAVDGLWHIWSRLPSIKQLVNDPGRAEERAAWASFSQVLSRWNERDPEATLREYQTLVDSEDFEAQPLLSYRAPMQDRVVISTLHQSKGLEFDVVFIADAVEGVFPDLRPGDSYLGVRHLLAHVPTDSANYRLFRLEEERRLAYTAMTRARNAVIWTATSTGGSLGAGMPSRFLPVVAGETPVIEANIFGPQDRMPITPTEAEAWLRRKTADPALAETERRAAMSLLAQGSRWGLRPVAEFAGMRTRGTDLGVVPLPLRLSPSQGESYATCPRRYVLERKLHIGPDSTTAATFGSLIHKIFEDVERSAWDNHARASSLDEALEHLDKLFDPNDFSGEPYAKSWHNRAVETLTRLYKYNMFDKKPVGLEQRLELDIDGVRWTGIADRIDRTPDGLRVVDYKTTKNLPTKAEAAISLQLGFYMLASRNNERLLAIDESVGGEFWYPSKELASSFAVRTFEPNQLDAVEEELRRITAGIAAHEFPPTPGPKCESCPVRLVCPEFPEGVESFA
ncbi:MAG: ATP-dependent helicase [Acidobacteria bacterium]|nr:ATP-dependent helicase [Acidobacteriota bacterium]